MLPARDYFTKSGPAERYGWLFRGMAGQGSMQWTILELRRQRNKADRAMVAGAESGR